MSNKGTWIITRKEDNKTLRYMITINCEEETARHQSEMLNEYYELALANEEADEGITFSYEKTEEKNPSPDHLKYNLFKKQY